MDDSTSTTRIFMAALGLACCLGPAHAAPETFLVPAWVYPGNPGARPGEQAPVLPAPSVDPTLLRVPGSSQAFTLAQTKDLYQAPDWHPEAHPPMPPIVAHGRKPAVYACAFCHLPDGSGRPENASIAGLPARYIVQQVRDMASGARRGAGPDPYVPSDFMRSVAQNVDEQELAAAAGYFANLPLKRRDEVVEAERIPITHELRWMHHVTAGAGDEPLGQRLLVIPVDAERHERRDAATVYRTYAPIGSLERGKQVVTTGAGGLSIACVSCHGPDLRGAPPAPPIAGRSPTYVLRQLIAFRTGSRQAPAGQPMQVVVQHMTLDDMIAVAAYVGSQEP
jgi:cytochrome c553